ncbi:retropepsin-like aspartic protease [Taibaiella chishuiensis]|uniref:Putative aspartyl protease n=1 Tax=Taibaiella chishuiensis TaxID=1434707 RepID=A0A2P8D8I2_9BACT|nr:retropepsin-like aspartic protease [Taibaiella chishuiensis]PSK93497.1 putative aspartyl protease [Taibaiella chishuiensis]
MRFYIVLCLFAGITLAPLSRLSAQQPDLNQGAAVQDQYYTVIPYSQVKGKIIVDVVLQGRKCKFIWDTGAPLSLSDSLSNALGLATFANINVADQSGAKDSIRIVKVPEISIGGVSFAGVPALAPKETEMIFRCFGVEGMIGSNLLRNTVVQFDSRNKQIILASDARKLTLSKKNALPMQLTPVQSNPFVKILLKKGKTAVSDNILLDSGADGFYEMSIGAYKYFSGRAAIIDLQAEGYGTYAGGLHGIAAPQQNFTLGIPELVLGKMTFLNTRVTTTYSDESRIGSELFDYGKVTLNYKDKLFYFEPYDNNNSRDLYRKLWPVQPVMEKDKIVVGIVWDKALSEEVHAGDEILSFGDMDYSRMSFCERVTSERNTGPDAVELKLKDARTGAIKTIKLERK